jgi:hypothetical protein
MTQGTMVVDYATPRAAQRRAIAGMGLVVAIAVVAALLGAGRFADEVGFPQVVNPGQDAGAIFLRILSGVIVGVFCLMLGLFLVRQAAGLAALLRQIQGRLSTGVAIALLICGTVCLIASLLVPLYFGRTAASMGMHLDINGTSMSVGNAPPLLSDLLAVLIFLAGVALAGIGVWGGIRPGVEPAHLAGTPPQGV